MWYELGGPRTPRIRSNVDCRDPLWIHYVATSERSRESSRREKEWRGVIPWWSSISWGSRRRSPPASAPWIEEVPLEVLLRKQLSRVIPQLIRSAIAPGHSWPAATPHPPAQTAMFFPSPSPSMMPVLNPSFRRRLF
ncbi:hypothetical protein BHM03_00053986 [Ensete ventricosum]|nr:hypothetical protein BHM03_00053986 [Ensete ventricosum]